MKSNTSVELPMEKIKVPVPKDAQKRWNQQYQHGDIAQIILKRPDLYRAQISQALQSKFAFNHVLDAIDEFYKEKKEIQERVLAKLEA